MNIIIATTAYLIIVVCCILVVRRRNAQQPRSLTAIPAILTAATLVLFLVLNVTNLCNPGWCGRYGFPFAYRQRSDVIIDERSMFGHPEPSQAVLAKALDSLVAISASLAAFLVASNLMKRNTGV